MGIALLRFALVFFYLDERWRRSWSARQVDTSATRFTTLAPADAYAPVVPEGGVTSWRSVSRTGPKVAASVKGFRGVTRLNGICFSACAVAVPPTKATHSGRGTTVSRTRLGHYPGPWPPAAIRSLVNVGTTLIAAAAPARGAHLVQAALPSTGPTTTLAALRSAHMQSKAAPRRHERTARVGKLAHPVV